MKLKPLPAALCRILGLVVLLAVSSCASSAPSAIVVGDVTVEGTKRRTPTKDSPIYYYPVVAGYQERGALVAGTKPPEETGMLRAVAKALAQEHYLLVKPGSTPDLMLVIWWGTINPIIDEMEKNEEGTAVNDSGEMAPTQIFMNKREMTALVGALKVNAPFKFDPGELKDAARNDRYFILIGAYDFAAAERKEKKLLWLARMSADSTGRAPDEVFPLLAASGAAVFGRDTTPATLDTSKPIKTPDVEVGPVEVIETPGEKKKP